MSEISLQTGLPIILDESWTRANQVEEFSKYPGKWIGNLRVSKMGGILRSLECVEQALAHSWPLIVGAQVGETSLLTRAALAIASNIPDSSLFAQEGAFGTMLLKQDPFSPCLMFGAHGILDLSGVQWFGPGWGMTQNVDTSKSDGANERDHGHQTTYR